jgi:16S rRNA G966 N2-methylase RsmD
LERLYCSCGWEITPQFDGDIGWLFHAVAEHKVHVSCGRQIGPYDCCTVVEGDCLELMKQLPDGAVDAVITDPPYGINAARDRNSQKWGWTDFAVTGWDRERPSPVAFAEAVRVSKAQAVWGGNYFTDSLPPRGKWLIWDKGQTDFSLADCEMAWTSLDGATRRIEYARALALQDGKVHPTQKPVAVMLWNILQMGEAETILDPFCGSGTTLVAAKKLGRHFLGFEISPEYCEIARKRIALVEAQPQLFPAAAPEQFELLGGKR